MRVMERVVTGVAALCLGAGLIYFLQGSQKTEPHAVRKAGQQPTATVTAAVTTRGNPSASVFGFPDSPHLPQPAATSVLAVAEVDDRLRETRPPQMRFVQDMPTDGCTTQLTADRELAAIIALSLSSPCHPYADFVIWHAQMGFSVQTDENGYAAVRAPALTTEAVFIVTLDNLEEARINVDVPDVRRYNRIAVNWRGGDSVHLHALENGATFGDPGHIWSAATQNAERALQGERGFMMRLGTSDARTPYLTEIYTLPFGFNSLSSDVSLMVGVAITAENCGRELDLTGIQTNAGRTVVTEEIQIGPLPCEQIGQSVMRDGLFDDLVVASR